jgi:glycosyltransferase involved in cell wall biosynthesis
MPGSPLVSVVMSVFNGERFLAEAVESILSQSFSDFEFIAINDGSTDNSGTILDSYQKKDSRLRVFHQENRGLVDSLNRGCGLTQGRYIARMDADDISLRDRLSWQVSFMEKHPEVSVVGGAVQFISASGRTLEISRQPIGDQEIKSALCAGNVIWHPTVLIRRDTFIATGGYRSSFLDAEEYDLWLRIAERSQLANLEQVVLAYRIHPHQISQCKIKQQALSALAARAAAASRKNGNPDPFTSPAQITPDLLARMGVGEAAQQRALIAGYLTFIRNMSLTGERSAVLNLWMEMLRSSRREYIERRVLADARLAFAELYWNQGRFLPSLLAAGHAVIMRPMILGRPLKLLWRWLKRTRKMQ